MDLYETIRLLCNFSTFLLLIGIISKVIKEKYLIVTSLVFWFTFFYFFYISFSCFFIEEINTRWNFSNQTLSLSRVLVFFYNIFFTFLITKCCNVDKTIKQEIVIKERYSFVYILALAIEFFASFVIIVAILKLVSLRRATTGVAAYFKIRDYAGILEKSFHIRLFLYLLLSSSFYLYMKKRRIVFFMPLFLIVTFETLANQRTTAFIVLLYVYVMYVCIKKKLQIKIIVPLLFLLLIGVLFTRAAALMMNVDVNIVFGEFFETFTTIPYMIEHNLMGAGFNLERALCDYTFATFIPGSIRLAIASYKSTGAEMAMIIGRGYGLASNFIFEPVFQFGYLGFFISLFIPLLLVEFDIKLKGWGNLLIKVLFIFQLRLYIREGITQFMITFYIFLTYCGLFYFAHFNQPIISRMRRGKRLSPNFSYIFKCC